LGDSADAALAATDLDQARVQVEIPDLEWDDFADSDAGFEHEPDDRLVAAVVEGLVRSGSMRGCAGTDECSELVVCERFDHGLIGLRRLHSTERVGGEQPLDDQPRGEPSDRELSDTGGPRCPFGIEHPATNRLREVRFIGSAPRSAHQRRYRRRPSP